MSDSARIVLGLLLKRLGPIVGEVTPADFGTWEGDDGEPGSVERQRRESGWYKFAAAVLEARRALASNDADAIAIAAELVCPPLERDGMKLAERHRAANAVAKAEANVAARRLKGGRRTGEKQTAAARAKYAPWQERYRTLLADGKTKPGKAIFVIRNEMERAGGNPPTMRTLRKHLR